MNPFKGGGLVGLSLGFALQDLKLDSHPLRYRDTMCCHLHVAPGNSPCLLGQRYPGHKKKK